MQGALFGALPFFWWLISGILSLQLSLKGLPMKTHIVIKGTLLVASLCVALSAGTASVAYANEAESPVAEQKEIAAAVVDDISSAVDFGEGSVLGSSSTSSSDKNPIAGQINDEKKTPVSNADSSSSAAAVTRNESKTESRASSSETKADVKVSVGDAADSSKKAAASLSGTAHIQDKGTVKASAKAGQVLSLGTIGQSKRLEGVSVKVSGINGSITYAAHVQDIGWQTEKKNGSFAGTTGKSLQMEAVWIKTTVQGYNVWYRVHVADNGWLGWAKNGEKAGSVGLAKQMEAMEVVVLPEGETPSGYNSSVSAFLKKVIAYTAHVQDIGNISNYTLSLGDTVTVGTTGKGKQLEGMSIKLNGVSGGISYKAHIENIGWQGAKANGAFAGTKGQSKQIEAAQLSLTGDLASAYDVFYRAHVANIGWMDWAKNGSSAGTVGYRVPVEALQFVIVKRGTSGAKSTNGINYIDPSKMPSMLYESISDGQSWKTFKTGAVVGTTGKSLNLTGVSMKANSGNAISGGIKYLAHFANKGWTSWCANGTRDTASWNPVQALKIALTGNLSKYFDVYYRTHVSNYGWMGWASNGAASGTSGLGMNAEAYQVKLVVKGSAAPGSTAKSYSDQYGFLGMPADQRAMLNRISGYGSGTGYLIAVNRGTHKVGVFSGSAGNWKLKYYWSCVTGAPSTPTITGTYSTTGGKRDSLSTDSRAIYCTQISGGYFFHSVLNSESELGQSLSHGCIRMACDSARWIYNNIWGGTTVTIYN